MQTPTTIARLTNGSVLLVEGNSSRRFVNLQSIELNTDGYSIRIVSLVNNKTIAAIKFTDLTTINGDDAPDTIQEAMDIIADQVFTTTIA